MTRRKRNTWQPNEITSIIRSSQDSSPNVESSAEHSPSSQDLPRNSKLEKDTEEVENELDARVDSTEDLSEEPKENDLDTLNDNCSATPIHLDSQLTRTKEDEHANTSQDILNGSLEDDDSVSQIARVAKGFALSATGNPNFKAPKDASTVSAELGDQSVPAPDSPRRMKRTSSMVRLSTSLDGKASVVLKGDTPSPPGKPQLKGSTSRSALQRSKSLLSAHTLPDVRQPILPVPRTYGRSRDARTWEFYCDSDVRESLTKTADHGQRGSAAGPIQLIRSGSAGRQALASATNKQNRQLQRQGSAKRKNEGLEKTKPKLARTTSSYARLQHSKSTSHENPIHKDEKSSTQPCVSKEYLGDSDKENWEPGSQRAYTRPKPSAARQLNRTGRGVLQDSASVPSLSTSLGVMMEQEKMKSRRNRNKSAFVNEMGFEVEENCDPAISKDGSESDRKEDDLDAVQNLLSLSQGAWA